jgi:hypothetical protein
MLSAIVSNEVDRPAGEPTVVAPDRVETVDLRSGKADRTNEIVTRARAASSEGEAIKVGRYQLLEIVGTGGMGMVWGAWDPELERRVALKLVRLTSRESRDRILREGQILARLSHPNVVPIFDVGVVGEQVYLVMEWVRGTTLRAYAEQTPGVRDMLEAYRQAGSGLAAAHRAGVIHRDFKPDNAVRGDDGRVRVLDFGLAHSHEAAAEQRIAGTPRYMAPEQARGEPVTATVDQYAFCVSLRDALERVGTVPARIAAIIERGTAAESAGRFASMEELLAALDRDPARTWRRGALAFGAVAAAVGAFAIGQSSSSGDAAAIEPCVGGPAEIATAWNPSVRDRVVAHLRTLGPRGKDGDRVARELDDYSGAWLSEQRRGCLAHERKELTLARYDAQLGCLARTRAQLAAIGELLGTVDANGLATALLAARMLPDVHGCADATEAIAPPPAVLAERIETIVPRIERALVRATARRADAVDEARVATTEARATAYAPLIARALLVEGRAAMVINRADADDLLAEATTLALRASDDVTAVEAYARWVFQVARNGVTTIDNWPVMAAVADRLGRRGRFARALMYNNRGVSRLVANDRPGARALFEQARTEAGDAPDIELNMIDTSLASLEATPERSEHQARRALARFESVLGHDHPDTHFARFLVALLVRDRAAARTAMAAACDGFERWEHAEGLAECTYEAAWLADDAGDVPEAKRWMARVPKDSTVRGRIAAAYLVVRSGIGNRAKVIAEMEQLANGPEVAERRADTLVVVALASEHAEARRAWQRALALLEPLDLAPYRRRIARASAVLAEHPETKPVEAAELATRALGWYRGARGDEPLVARLERITGSAGSH